MHGRLCIASAAALAWLGAATAAADPVLVTGTPSPFATCTADDPGGQPGTLWQNSEVEPWVDVNPLDAANVVGVWQQDRWSNGGARGLVSGVSRDGGATWAQVPLPFSKCAGWLYERASDPWVSFGPDGKLYAVSIGFNAFTADSAVTVSTSADGGSTWTPPVDVIHDDDPTVFNDKESVTADPTRPGYAYVVWDRIHR